MAADNERVRRPLPGVLLRGACCSALVMLAMAFVAACSPSTKSPSARTQGVTADMTGTSAGTHVLINETVGTVGGIRLGESLASVRKLVPARFYWSALDASGQDAIYCSLPSGDSCNGVMLHIFDRCGLAFCINGSTHGVAEISLQVIGDPDAYAPSRAAETLKGIHIGSPARSVLKAYKITDVGPNVCASAGSAPDPGRTFVTVTKANTLAISSHAGRVWAISLFSGRQPHLCRNHVVR
jgi:hypothetical protein